MPTPASRPIGRGSPRVRLISSLAMLLVAVGAVWFYSIRETNTLFTIGVNGHIHCALAGPAGTVAELGNQFAPLRQPVADATGLTAVSGTSCNVDGRLYQDIILAKGQPENQAPISIILTARSDQEAFPRALSGQIVHTSGVVLHEGRLDGYSVAGFEAGAFLAYIVSTLPAGQNAELARRAAPIIESFLKH